MTRRAHGLRAWLWQRLSAAYLVVFLLVAVVWVLVRPPAGFEEWRALVAAPFVNAALAVFFAALLIHTWVGLRNVVIDYVRPASLRVGVLLGVAVVLVLLGVWAMLVLTAVVRL